MLAVLVSSRIPADIALVPMLSQRVAVNPALLKLSVAVPANHDHRIEHVGLYGSKAYVVVADDPAETASVKKNPVIAPSVPKERVKFP